MPSVKSRHLSLLFYISIPIYAFLPARRLSACCAQLQQFSVDHSAADGDVRVSSFKMFHPPSDTADTHAAISRHTTKSLVDDSWRVSLRRNSKKARWRNYMSVTPIFSQCMDGDVRCAHALILYSCWRGKMTLMVLYGISTHFVNPLCSFLLERRS
jgi:hypothetical protein